MANIVKDFQKLNKMILTEDGQYVTELKMLYGDELVDTRKFEALKGLMELVVRTKIVSENTRNFIKSNDSSVRTFVENYNNFVTEEKQLKPASVSQNVNYDRKKLINYFPDNIISELLNPYKTVNLDEVEKNINKAAAKYGGNRGILKNLHLDLDRLTINENLSDADFKNLIDLISPYTTNFINYLEKNMDKKQVGYLNYLVSAFSLDSKERERLDILEDLLSVKVTK